MRKSAFFHEEFPMNTWLEQEEMNLRAQIRREKKYLTPTDEKRKLVRLVVLLAFLFLSLLGNQLFAKAI